MYDSIIMWDSLWVTDSQAEMVSAPPPTPKPFAEQARPPPVAADPAPADDDDAKFVTPWKVIFAFSCFYNPTKSYTYPKLSKHVAVN